MISPSEKQLVQLFKTATIVLDTNVLLQLYRVSTDTREMTIKTLVSLSSRLWIPYQVAYEFVKNRPSEIVSLRMRPESITKKCDTFINELKQLHLSDDEQRSLRQRLKNWENSYVKNHPVENVDDMIMDILYTVLDKRVGEKLNKKTIEALTADAKQRFQDNVPPGNKDKTKDSNAYGDYIIWKQMIDYAKEKKCNIIFVSNDQKDDWIQVCHGQKFGPRIELYDEFHSETEGQIFHMYSLPSFLSFYADSIGEAIDNRNISELESTQLSYSNLHVHSIPIINTDYIQAVREIALQSMKDIELYNIQKNILETSYNAIEELKKYCYHVGVNEAKITQNLQDRLEQHNESFANNSGEDQLQAEGNIGE